MSTPAHTTRPDLLAGRLLNAPNAPAAPLEPLAQLPFPIGAAAPVAGHPGTWTAAADTGMCLEHDIPHVTTARPGLTDPRPEQCAVFSVRVDVPGTPAPPFRLHGTAPVPPLPPGRPA
jgi:hypothetical protein